MPPVPAMMLPMKRKKESLMLGRLLKKMGRKIGASVAVEPEWGIVGQITFKNGKKSYFRYNTLDLNPVGASDIAKDKGYATYFLKRMGYSTVPGDVFYSASWCTAIGSRRDVNAAYRYAKKLGFPVIVKPNSGSQGTDVALVHNKMEFFRALRSIFKNDRIALVQRKVEGHDYRIVVLDTNVISAYERLPLNVTGDGRSTILELLRKKQRSFVASSRDTRLKTNDPRIAGKLKHQGLGMRSILPRDERIFLLDNANLSSGGDSIDVTRAMHPAFKKLAVDITRDMGLRMCGVDLMVDGDIREEPERYWVLEINAAPGLDHYVKGGKAQEKIVNDLYLQVLKHLEK